MNNKIKVLMVGTLPLDLQSVRGGVEAAILNLFSGFSQLENIEIVHIAFIDTIQARIEIKYASNIKIYFVPFKIKIRLLDYFVNPELEEIVLKEVPDIIHIQESEPHLIRFLGFKKDNIVITQHGIMKEELKYASGIQGKLKFYFKTLVESYLFPNFQNFIFISTYNQKLFKGKIVRSRQIYNAVNPIFFDHKPSLPAVKNAIIYVGVISQRKNLKILIEALQALKNKKIIFELHIVGWFKENELQYQKEIMGLINKYDLSGQIKFYGWLKQHEVLEVFDRCASFVLSSLQETLPVSIAEAMALGKVVIASNVGAVSEMFEDKLSGYLYDKNELTELVELLESLATEKFAQHDFSSVIKKRATEKYHPLKNAMLTADFYREIIASNKILSNK